MLPAHSTALTRPAQGIPAGWGEGSAPGIAAHAICPSRWRNKARAIEGEKGAPPSSRPPKSSSLPSPCRLRQRQLEEEVRLHAEAKLRPGETGQGEAHGTRGGGVGIFLFGADALPRCFSQAREEMHQTEQRAGVRKYPQRHRPTRAAEPLAPCPPPAGLILRGLNTCPTRHNIAGWVHLQSFLPEEAGGKELGARGHGAPQPTARQGAKPEPGRHAEGRLRPRQHRHGGSKAPKSTSPRNKAALSLQMQNKRRAAMIYFSSPVDRPASETGLR